MTDILLAPSYHSPNPELWSFTWSTIWVRGEGYEQEPEGNREWRGNKTSQDYVQRGENSRKFSFEDNYLFIQWLLSKPLLHTRYLSQLQYVMLSPYAWCFFLCLILFDIHGTDSERNIIFLFYRWKDLEQKVEVSYSSSHGNWIAELVWNQVLWLQQIADRFFLHHSLQSPW